MRLYATIKAMETRMERYAKYREQIKRMSPDEFTPKKVNKDEMESVKDAVAPELSFAYDEQPSDTGRNSAPYSLYLKKRKRWLVVKIIALALAIAGFIVWWFLMQGRK